MQEYLKNNPTNSSLEIKQKKPYLFKIQISPEKYLLLQKKFNFKKIKESSHFYFDTNKEASEAKLFKQKIRLRVKIEDNKYLLEFKKKDEKIFEITQPISPKDFEDILKGIFPEGDIKKELNKLDSSFKLEQVGTSTSTKSKADFLEGVLILDKTIYDHNNSKSYGIEFRSLKSYSEDKIKDIINKKLEIIDIKINKTKLELLWEKEK